MPFEGKQRPSRSRLSHKQEMETTHIEGNQYQPQSGRTRSVDSKTKDNASIRTNDIILKRTHK